MVLLGGCVTTNSIRPEDLEHDTSKEIFLKTRDGRTIRMFAGDYGLVDSSNVLILCGKGHLFLNPEKTDYARFQGTISLQEIVSIETREKTIFYYTGPIILGFSVLLVIVVMIILNGRGFGG
jgi:hypothetical protein